MTLEYLPKVFFSYRLWMKMDSSVIQESKYKMKYALDLLGVSHCYLRCRLFFQHFPQHMKISRSTLLSMVYQEGNPFFSRNILWQLLMNAIVDKSKGLIWFVSDPDFFFFYYSEKLWVGKGMGWLTLKNGILQFGGVYKGILGLWENRRTSKMADEDQMDFSVLSLR